jgi:hypothetical protein
MAQGINSLVNYGGNQIAGAGLKLVATFNAYDGSLGADTFGAVSLSRGIFYAIQSDLGRGSFATTSNQYYFPTSTVVGASTAKIQTTASGGDASGVFVSSNFTAGNCIDRNAGTTLNPNSVGCVTLSVLLNTFNTNTIYFTSGTKRRTFMCKIIPNKVSVVFSANPAAPVVGFQVYKSIFDPNTGFKRSNLLGSNQLCTINGATTTLYSTSLSSVKSGSLFEFYLNQNSSGTNSCAIQEIEMYGIIELYEFTN